MKVSIFKLERCEEPPYSSEHDLIVLLGPHSKNLLLRKYFFRDIDSKCKNNCVIIPSSYDDTAVYKILEREYGMKIVWSTYVHKELVVINSLHRDYSKYIQYYSQNKSLKRIIVFIEASPKLKKDLSYQNMEILNRLVVFHGVWGSPGVIIDDAIKISASLNYDHQVLIDYERRSLCMRICSSRNNFVMKLYFS
ncbi:MAG: hypothetical protein ACP5I7_06475 [Sulfolobales archaeon]|jgi:hypothetical protein